MIIEAYNGFLFEREVSSLVLMAANGRNELGRWQWLQPTTLKLSEMAKWLRVKRTKDWFLKANKVDGSYLENQVQTVADVVLDARFDVNSDVDCIKSDTDSETNVKVNTDSEVDSAIETTMAAVRRNKLIKLATRLKQWQSILPPPFKPSKVGDSAQLLDWQKYVKYFKRFYKVTGVDGSHFRDHVNCPGCKIMRRVFLAYGQEELMILWEHVGDIAKEDSSDRAVGKVEAELIRNASLSQQSEDDVDLEEKYNVNFQEGPYVEDVQNKIQAGVGRTPGKEGESPGQPWHRRKVRCRVQARQDEVRDICDKKKVQDELSKARNKVRKVSGSNEKIQEVPGGNEIQNVPGNGIQNVPGDNEKIQKVLGSSKNDIKVNKIQAEVGRTPGKEGESPEQSWHRRKVRCRVRARQDEVRDISGKKKVQDELGKACNKVRKVSGGNEKIQDVPGGNKIQNIPGNKKV